MLVRLPCRLAISLSVLWLSCVMTVTADEARWQQYMQAGMEAYQRGNYPKAVRQTQFALKEAEDFGEEDPRFALSLNNLAGFYQAQGRYAEAEPMYDRALTIAVKIFGPQHPKTRTLLQNFSALYRTQGRDQEAERLLREHGQ